MYNSLLSKLKTNDISIYIDNCFKFLMKFSSSSLIFFSLHKDTLFEKCIVDPKSYLSYFFS